VEAEKPKQLHFTPFPAAKSFIYIWIFNEEKLDKAIESLVGHPIHPFLSRYSKLWQVGNVEHAFRTHEKTETYVRANPIAITKEDE
jgi:hypothetical protein